MRVILAFLMRSFSGLNQAHHMQAILDAARFRELGKKNAVIEKKVRKAPVATRPKAASQPALQTKLKKAEAKLKQTGAMDDAIEVKRLKRQLKGQ